MNLEPIYNDLFNQGIPPRTKHLAKVKRLFKRHTDAINLVQSVYFGVGAHYTQSNPVWTNEINPHKRENLKLWLTKQPDLKTLTGSNLKLATRYKITDFLEENGNDITYLNEMLSLNQRPEKIINNLRISTQDIDSLSISEILEIRKSKEHQNLQDYILKNVAENDFGISKERLESERKSYENRKKVLVASCTILGFIPLIGYFVNLPIAAMELFFSDKLKKGLGKNLPLLSFSETVIDKINSGNNTRQKTAKRA